MPLAEEYEVVEHFFTQDAVEAFDESVGQGDEDRLDAQAADEALAEANAKGEKPVPWAQAKADLGL